MYNHSSILILPSAFGECGTDDFLGGGAGGFLSLRLDFVAGGLDKA